MGRLLKNTKLKPYKDNDSLRDYHRRLMHRRGSSRQSDWICNCFVDSCCKVSLNLIHEVN